MKAIELIKEKLEAIELKYSKPLNHSGSTTLSDTKERLLKLTPILKSFNDEATNAINEMITEGVIELTEELRGEIKQQSNYSVRRITRAVTGMQ
ncbi:MAG: hypothetical protein V4561_10465 [Bacteroidota bacterium]